MQEIQVRSLVQEDSLEEGMATHPVFLPGEFQGWGSLVGCRLWGRTESDTTETTLQQQQQDFIMNDFNEAVDVFQEFPCFLYDSTNVGNLISFFS